MPAFVFNIRLDGKNEGCVKVTLEDGQSLKDARGLIVAQAAEQLGQQVLLRHFLVTVRGRTGYLEPQWEECSITELMPLTYSQVGLDLTAHVDSPRSTRSGEWPRIFAITA